MTDQERQAYEQKKDRDLRSIGAIVGLIVGLHVGVAPDASEWMHFLFWGAAGWIFAPLLAHALAGLRSLSRWLVRKVR